MVCQWAMSLEPLPPVPALIPISALRSSSSLKKRCLEVMGEQRQRLRRSSAQPTPDDLIDSTGTAARSRGASDAPPPERHRKSERRRDHNKGGRKHCRSSHHHHNSKHRSVTEEKVERVNPRVNPIFVWVRQEDTHIVDVKCEDYDKRNRIVLTKTPQGWRAIPRTENMVPTLKGAVVEEVEGKFNHLLSLITFMFPPISFD